MALSYRIQLIPASRRQRPGYVMKSGRPASLTVHNTANPNATAAGHADYYGRSELASSAHIFVDDVEAVLCIPLSEQAWHSGTNAGNTTSGGIEVCEFTDPARQEQADRNAQRLIADMLTGRAPVGFQTPHLTLEDVRTHQSWMQYGTSGKYCPRLLLPRWDEFKCGIAEMMKPPTPTPTHAVYLVWAPTNQALRDFICPAVTEGFAATLTAVGGQRRLALSLSGTDALAYTLQHGRSAPEMFEPIGKASHCVAAFHTKLEWGDENIMRRAADAKLAVNSRTCGTSSTGFEDMTAALTQMLEVGVDFVEVFGVGQ